MMVDHKSKIVVTDINIDTEKKVIEEKNKTEEDDNEKSERKEDLHTSKSILGYLKVHLTPQEIHNASI